VRRAPHQRGRKVDELVDRLIKIKSVFLSDLKLLIRENQPLKVDKDPSGRC